ncbi:MAG: ATP-binding cassette domain-containing protein, partial [bacterium]
GEVAMRLIGHLSKGYRQRVGLAQALVNNPPVLILDEPTAGLDPKQIVEIRHLIRGLKGEHTILLSTHILPEVSMVCDRVIIIDRGRVAHEGRTEDLGGEDAFVRVSALGPAEEIRRALAGVAGVREVSQRKGEGEEAHFTVRADRGREIRPELAEAAARAGGRLTGLAQDQNTLEDLFVRIVSSERAADGEDGRTEGENGPDGSPAGGGGDA